MPFPQIRFAAAGGTARFSACEDGMNMVEHALARRYRAIFFDLDGTLLPMELDEFLGSYFTALDAFVRDRGYDSQAFSDALNASIKAMAHHDRATNAQAFWETFGERFPARPDEMKRLLDEFYAGPFCHVGDAVVPNPSIRRAIDVLREKGYPLVVATMPLFPPAAVRERLRWAGLDPASFSRITTYENSRSVKPKLSFYAENLAACGIRGEEALMVGNNTVEDLAALGLGIDGYLVTDHLLDPVSYDLSTVAHGSTQDFVRFAESLPVCEDPARAIEKGPIDAASAQEVLSRDALPEALFAEQAAREAARASNERIARDAIAKEA